MVVKGMVTNVFMFHLKWKLLYHQTWLHFAFSSSFPPFSYFSSPPAPHSPPPSLIKKLTLLAPTITQAIHFSMHSFHYAEDWNVPSTSQLQVPWMLPWPVSRTSAHLSHRCRWSWNVPDCVVPLRRDHMPHWCKVLCCRRKCTWFTCVPYLGMETCHA